MDYSIPALAPKCAYCGSKDRSLAPCLLCGLQYYCSQEHELADMPSHGDTCCDIRISLSMLQLEEDKLRNHRGDASMPANPFQSAFGLFSHFRGTITYMDARLDYLAKLREVRTYASVALQLRYVMDSLKLSHGEQLDFSDMAPHLMLRLHKDQDAYDFIKWYQTTAKSSTHQWSPTCAWLDIKDADIFENVHYLTRDRNDTTHIIAVMLLKVRILQDLIFLKLMGDAETLIRRLPGNIIEKIIKEGLAGSVVKAKRLTMSDQRLVATLGNIVKQMRVLYRVVDKRNGQIWPGLCDSPTNQGPARISELYWLADRATSAWLESRDAAVVIRYLHETM